jgi:hypothetical protein
MGVVIGVISSTAVEKKQKNLLCGLTGGTNRSCRFDFQIECAASGLRNK